jgi:pimeloyl-ACP methyl ester carboxylesterase
VAKAFKAVAERSVFRIKNLFENQWGNMKNVLTSLISCRSVWICLVSLIAWNSANSQRTFEIAEISVPPQSSNAEIVSINDNGEAIGRGAFQRCVNVGGGGNLTFADSFKISKNASEAKLETVCFNESKPIYWSQSSGSITIGLPGVFTNPLTQNNGSASQINNSGLITGSATRQLNTSFIYQDSVNWFGFSGSWLTPTPPPLRGSCSINNQNQTLCIACAEELLTPISPCYRRKFFIIGNGAIVQDNNSDSYSVASNFNDRGEVVFNKATFSNGTTTTDILLFSSGVLNSIKSLLPDLGYETSYKINNNGDILDYTNKLLINNPLNSPKIKHLDAASVSFSDFNDSEQMIGYDSILQKPVLWNEVSGSISISLPKGSEWTISYLIDLNNKGQILAKGIKNGVSKFLLLTPKPPPPLIFVPGTMGSELYRKSDRQKYWINTFFGSILGYNNYLTLDPTSDYYLGQDAFSAKDALRTVNFAGYNAKSIYDPLLKNLVKYGGYKEYRLDPSLWGILPPSEGGCDRSQLNLSDASKNPTLFVFPYDYRFDNADSAAKLDSFIDCVQQFYPNKPINLLGHSQGGLVSRRYIIDHPTDHNIDKLITIATPFLGAPEAIYKLETGGDWKGVGWFELYSEQGGNLPFVFAAITPTQLKFLAKDFKSVHQLLPSREYSNLFGRTPLKEIGDVDGNGVLEEFYDYDQLVNFLDNDFSTHPGTTGKIFHDCLPANQTKCQDDWRNDTSGVSYMHLVGQQARDRTTAYVEVKNEVVVVPNYPHSTFRLQRVFLPVKGPGDGTVPEISASRNNRNDINLNAPGTRRITFFTTDETEDPQYEHNGLTQNNQILKYVLHKLGLGRDPRESLFGLSKSKINSPSVSGQNEDNSPLPARKESFYTKIIGISDTEISDELGNKTTRDGDIFINKVAGLDYSIIGDKALFLTLPTTQTHFTKFQVGDSPFNLEVVKGMNNQSPNLAVRYQDVSLPQGTFAQLKITNTSQVVLRYDSDGDGSYETLIQPTAQVTGASAADRTPPKVDISVLRQGSSATITLTAQDAESGIKQILYSLDGQTFDIYTNPISVNVINPITILAVADNNIGMRSGLYQKTLLIPTAANASIRGRISNGNRGVRATLTLAKVNTGEVFTTRTNPFGYYRFDNLQVGAEYILTPLSKNYRFNPTNKLVSLTEDLNDQDFQVSTEGGQQ